MKNNLIDITYDENSFYAKGRHFNVELDGVTDIKVKRAWGDPDTITFLLMDGTAVAIKGYQVASLLDLKTFSSEYQRTLDAEWQEPTLIEGSDE